MIWHKNAKGEITFRLLDIKRHKCLNRKYLGCENQNFEIDEQSKDQLSRIYNSESKDISSETISILSRRPITKIDLSNVKHSYLIYSLQDYEILEDLSIIKMEKIISKD